MATKYVILTKDPIPEFTNPETGETIQYGNTIAGVTEYAVDGPNDGITFQRDTTDSGFIPRDQIRFVLPYEVSP